MLDSKDHKTLTRSQQTAHLLVDDLRELARADQPLLAEFASELLRSTVEVKLRLDRLLTLCSPKAENE